MQFMQIECFIFIISEIYNSYNVQKCSYGGHLTIHGGLFRIPRFLFHTTSETNINGDLIIFFYTRRSQELRES